MRLLQRAGSTRLGRFKRELFIFGSSPSRDRLGPRASINSARPLQIRWRRWLTERYVAI